MGGVLGGPRALDELPFKASVKRSLPCLERYIRGIHGYTHTLDEDVFLAVECYQCQEPTQANGYLHCANMEKQVFNTRPLVLATSVELASAPRPLITRPTRFAELHHNSLLTHQESSLLQNHCDHYCFVACAAPAATGRPPWVVGERRLWHPPPALLPNAAVFRQKDVGSTLAALGEKLLEHTPSGQVGEGQPSLGAEGSSRVARWDVDRSWPGGGVYAPCGWEGLSVLSSFLRFRMFYIAAVHNF